MLTGIIGKKIKQTQMFTEEGLRIPVTYIEAGPCVITQIRKEETDGYDAVQLGFGVKKKSRLKKPVLGHLEKAGLKKSFCSVLREVRFKTDDTDLKLGMKITADQIFQKGDKVKISGMSKGKGFAGVVKRHGFKGGSRTHGQSDRERAPGSIGQTTTPGRVYKGKRMAGRMGTMKVTLQAEIVDLNKDKNMLIVKGLIPGRSNSILIIKKLK